MHTHPIQSVRVIHVFGASAVARRLGSRRRRHPRAKLCRAQLDDRGELLASAVVATEVGLVCAWVVRDELGCLSFSVATVTLRICVVDIQNQTFVYVMLCS